MAGAASHAPTDWQTLDWQRVHRNVRRLQARIVQATQAGRWGKVKALQHLLTHSFSGKALAVRRVTDNQGKRTSGVDGVTWTTPEQKATALHALRQRGYHPQPLRRVHIPKSNGNMRPLSIPVMADRAMQALYLLALDPVAETTSDPNSYGFRKERSTADAMQQCFNVLAKRTAPCWVLEGDIRSCFDRISHTWLRTHIPMPTAILHAWLKAGFMEHHVLHATETGTPQGGICSPVLANLTLDGLERLLRHHFPPSKQAKVNYIRFADDFIITGTSKELLEDEVKPLVVHFLRERGLELSAEQTRITHVDDGFDFLGQNVRKYNGKLLITPARKNVQTFLRTVRALIKANPTTTAGRLIMLLNPVIRGWAHYHQHVVSKATFNSVDRAIYYALWCWAKRRHRAKSNSWIGNKYFPPWSGRQAVFTGELPDKQEQRRVVRLLYAAHVPIKRHTKIKGQANPYDPRWEVYFEHRLGVNMSNDLRGRRQLLALWQEQRGICPVCNQKITQLTRWHNHHVIWRTHGGADTAENRVLLHPACHKMVHSQRVEVVKPRPIKGV
jgi:RNA-directed DNA polymerase